MQKSCKNEICTGKIGNHSLSSSNLIKVIWAKMESINRKEVEQDLKWIILCGAWPCLEGGKILKMFLMFPRVSKIYFI